MPDPFIPKHPHGVAGENLVEPPPVDILRAMGMMFRGLAMTAVFLLLLCGAYYAIDVFRQIGALVNNPATGKAAVDSLAEIIDAPQLSFPVNGKSVGFGKVAAVIILGIGYLLWAWVPLTILSVSGRLLLTLAGDKKPPAAPRPR